MSVEYAKNYFKKIQMTGWRAAIAEKITKEISSRLNFLSDVGLDYLSINRSADTLSGGEAQRIKLAKMFTANFKQYTGEGVTDYTAHGPAG